MTSQASASSPDRLIQEAFIAELDQKWKQVTAVTCFLAGLSILYFIWQDFFVLQMGYLLPWRLLFLASCLLVVLASLFFYPESRLIGRLAVFAKFCGTTMMMGAMAQTHYAPITVSGSMALMILVLLIVQYGWAESLLVLCLPWLGLLGYSLIVHPGEFTVWLPALSNPGVVALVALPVSEIQYRLRLAEFRSRYQLKQIDKAKDEFFSIVTHDLKSPLAAVLGYAAILLGGRPGPLSEEQTREIAIIKKQGEELQALIDTILDYSRSEFGKIVVNKEAFDLAASVREILQQVKTEADKKNISLAAELPAEEVRITADKRMIERVIANLLTNAVKYTPDNGRIALTVERLANAVRVSVKDNGIGVEQDKLPRIFEKFYLIDEKRARDSRSLGLGLHISRTFVEAHGGKIAAQSDGPGRGTTVSFTLPA